MKALNRKFLVRPRSGMIVKDTVYLKPGHYYYRFAHSSIGGVRQSRERIVGGAWWLDADAFNFIRMRAARGESSLGEQARRSLAVATQWGGTMDIVVKALVKGPLAGFVGIGTIQEFDREKTEDLPVWIPDHDIVQIYVPGLLQKNPQTGNYVFADAFFHVEQSRTGWA